MIIVRDIILFEKWHWVSPLHTSRAIGEFLTFYQCLIAKKFIQNIDCNAIFTHILFHYRNLSTMCESNLEHFHTCLFDVVCVFQSSTLWLYYKLSMTFRFDLSHLCICCVFYVVHKFFGLACKTNFSTKSQS